MPPQVQRGGVRGRPTSRGSEEIEALLLLFIIIIIIIIMFITTTISYNSSSSSTLEWNPKPLFWNMIGEFVESVSSWWNYNYSSKSWIRFRADSILPDRINGRNRVASLVCCLISRLLLCTGIITSCLFAVVYACPLCLFCATCKKRSLEAAHRITMLPHVTVPRLPSELRGRRSGTLAEVTRLALSGSISANLAADKWGQL